MKFILLKPLEFNFAYLFCWTFIQIKIIDSATYGL